MSVAYPDDEYVTPPDRKVFEAFIYQGGTNPPLLTVKKNDFGVEFPTVYDGVGAYRITGLDQFHAGRTKITTSNLLDASLSEGSISLVTDADDVLSLVADSWITIEVWNV